MPPLIGLYSPAPQSGKTTLAEALARCGFARLRFAAPLKAALRAILAEAGEDPATIERMIEGDLKQAPAEALAGETPRWAMQTLGTEWGRRLIGENLWVDLLIRRAAKLRAIGQPVVCDDMRFPNEAEAIRAAGGVLIRIERPGAAAPNGHASEGALEGFRFDLRLRNDAASAEGFARDALYILEPMVEAA